MPMAPSAVTSKLLHPALSPLRRPIAAVATFTSSAIPEPHPSLEVIGGAKDRFLPAFRTLHRGYDPFPIIGWNCHIETMFAAFFRTIPEVRYRRQCLRTKDDGAIALDWVAGDRRRLPPDSPVLILLPGLTGGSQDSYVRHMLVRARGRGFRVVVFNGRGCANSPVTTPQFYSASFIGDMQEVVAHLMTRYPEANLYAVGWSLGGNILVRYMGEVRQSGCKRKANMIRSRTQYSYCLRIPVDSSIPVTSIPFLWRNDPSIAVFFLQEAHDCPLSGAVSLCNPFNLVMSDKNLREGFNNIYDKSLSNSLRKIFSGHVALFEDAVGEYNIPLALNANSVRDFDEAITRVSFGFKSADDYYSNSSSSDMIKHIHNPLLCIQAANDPIAPIDATPREDIMENQNCMLIVTPNGGHLGWVAGDEAPIGAPWTDALVMDFLEYLENDASKAGDSHFAEEAQLKSSGACII